MILAAGSAPAAEEKKESKSGKVVVEFVVGEDGRPTKIKIIKATDKKLAASVIETVSKWQLDRKYAGQRLRQPFEFQLDNEAPEKKEANQTAQPTRGKAPRG